MRRFAVMCSARSWRWYCVRRTSRHNAPQTVNCPASSQLVKISVSALLELATWCQQRIEQNHGGQTCTSPGTNDDWVKGGVHQLPLNQLWKQLPDADRVEIGQLLAQMIARQILPPGREEESHE